MRRETIGWPNPNNPREMRAAAHAVATRLNRGELDDAYVAYAGEVIGWVRQAQVERKHVDESDEGFEAGTLPDDFENVHSHITHLALGIAMPEWLADWGVDPDDPNDGW